MKNKTIFILLGLLISLIFLALALREVDWQLFLDTLATVQLSWMAFSGLILVLSVGIRTLRWTIVSGADLSEYYSFWRAANIGYLGNMILPARAGEVMRLAAVNKFAHIPWGGAVSGLVADRIADGLAMCLFLVMVLAYHGRQTLDANIFIGLATIFIGLASFLFIFILFGDKIPSWVGVKLGRWPFFALCRDVYCQAFDALQVLRSLGRLAIIAFLSILAFTMDCVMLLVLMSAFGLSFSFMAAATVAVFLAAGSLLPGAPGYVGIYQLACVLAFRLFGIDASIAVAYSVSLNILLLASFGFLGGTAIYNIKK